ncbi:MAG: hypothetical protein QGD92_08085 [Gammaproteobacteria bacterium]|nr:hypothetical protein [Gammaproteobacteria bacterium]
MGKAFQCLLGYCPEADQRRLAEKQEQARKQIALLQRIQYKKLELERREKAREERQRKEFQRAKTRMLDQMRGSLTNELKPRNLATTLEVIERPREKDIFRISMLVPRDLTTSNEKMTIDAKYHCVSLLLQKSSEAAEIGLFEEAHFLSKEASSLTSDRGSTDIQCPEIPEIIELPTISDRKQETLRKQTFVASNILGKLAQQVATYQTVQNSIARGEEKVENAKLQVEIGRVKVEQLKQRSQPIVKEMTEEKSIDIPTPVQEAERKSAMEVALQALELATNAFSKNKEKLGNLNTEKEKAKSQIFASRDLLVRATKDPKLLNILYDEFSAEAEEVTKLNSSDHTSGSSQTQE